MFLSYNTEKGVKSVRKNPVEAVDFPSSRNV